jgi:hypothetical protein
MGFNFDFCLVVERENLNLIVCLRELSPISLVPFFLFCCENYYHQPSINYFVMQFKCFEIELFKLIALSREIQEGEGSLKNVDEYFLFLVVAEFGQLGDGVNSCRW